MGRLNDRATKPPDALAKKSLPDNVTDQVPETKTYLFIKLPDLILLIDPDSQATEIARHRVHHRRRWPRPAPPGLPALRFANRIRLRI